MMSIIRDVTLRIPGAAIIEIIKLPNVLSVPDSRKEKERSDGTSEYSECILVPKGDYNLWDATVKAKIPLLNSKFKIKIENSFSVVLYPLSGEIQKPRFRQCLDLFNRLCRKNGILIQEE